MWVARYDGPINAQEEAYALAVDQHGYIYVTGKTNGVYHNYDYATVKYDPDGNQVWEARYNYGDDQAASIAVDGEGNVYVTGISNNDYLTVKYDADGNELWAERYDGVGNSHDEAVDLKVDESGNVYVTGRSQRQGGTNAEYDYATIKYDTDGNELWVSRYQGSAELRDEARALVVDKLGNVYVTGNSDGIGTAADFTTIKYDADGNEVWVERYDGPGGWMDFSNAIELDDY